MLPKKNLSLYLMLGICKGFYAFEEAQDLFNSISGNSVQACGIWVCLLGVDCWGAGLGRSAWGMGRAKRGLLACQS